MVCSHKMDQLNAYIETSIPSTDFAEQFFAHIIDKELESNIIFEYHKYKMFSVCYQHVYSFVHFFILGVTT